MKNGKIEILYDVNMTRKMVAYAPHSKARMVSNMWRGLIIVLFTAVFSILLYYTPTGTDGSVATITTYVLIWCTPLVSVGCGIYDWVQGMNYKEMKQFIHKNLSSGEIEAALDELEKADGEEPARIHIGSNELGDADIDAKANLYAAEVSCGNNDLFEFVKAAMIHGYEIGRSRLEK